MEHDPKEVEAVMRKHTVYVTAGTMAGAVAVAEMVSGRVAASKDAVIADLEQDLKTRIKTIADLSVANEKLRKQLRDRNE